MRRRLCLVAVALVGLAACSQPSGPAGAETDPKSLSATTAPPTPLSSPSPTTAPLKLASDGYPSAPHVNSVFLGNGVYGNALVLSLNDAGAWYWDGKRWIVSRKPGAAYPSSPPVFDPLLRRSIALAGGATGDGFTTWAWDGSSWSLLGPGPDGDGPPLIAFDYATNQLIAVVGNIDWTTTATWVLEGVHWKRVGGSAANPQARLDAGLAYDPSSKQLVLHGGILSQGQGNRVSVADTWTWNGTTWTEQNPTTNPPPGWDSLAYDPASHRLILLNVAVVDEVSAPTAVSMWMWADANWHRLSLRRMPTVGFSPQLTYDKANHQFILFEGTYNAVSYKYGSQTWVLARDTWKRVG